MNDSDLRRTFSLTIDFQVLHYERLKYKKNINSLRNNLTGLRIILKYLSLDCFVLNEAKLNESFRNAQFTLDVYKIRAKTDRNKFGGGLIEYVRKGLIFKRIAKYGPKCSVCICFKITFSKKKCIIFGIYKPPNVKNLKKRIERGNQAPFMSKEFQKAIYTRSD